MLDRFHALLIFTCFGCATMGCSGGPKADYSQLDLAEVRGVISLDGQPLAGALVVFEAPDQSYSFAQADGQGQYQLMFNSEKSGVMPGEKTVRIRTSGGLGEGLEIEEAEVGEGAEGEGATGADEELVPSCYNSGSKLNVTVASGSQTFDFDLSSDCSVTGATN